MDSHLRIIATISAGISGNPWPRENPWTDVLPLVFVEAAGFPDRGPLVDNESYRPGIVRIPVVASVDRVEDNGSSPAPVVAKPNEATSLADGISPSGDAPARRKNEGKRMGIDKQLVLPL